MRNVSRPGVLPVLLALAVGCDRSGGRAPERGSASSAPRAETPAVASAAPAGAWTVDDTGIGPVRTGMTVAQADSVLGGALRVAGDPPASCTYASAAGSPPGVRFMVVDGRIARVDVDSASVATASGARVGDAEERVAALYRGRVRVTPHKYEPGGHYLEVTLAGAAGGDHRTIFETDGHRVTRFRVGKLPEVEWVEGCS